VHYANQCEVASAPLNLRIQGAYEFLHFFRRFAAEKLGTQDVGIRIPFYFYCEVHVSPTVSPPRVGIFARHQSQADVDASLKFAS
jgi:hypothetical protein